MMGDGVGIITVDGDVYAPFDGKVETLFPTGHALGMVKDGVEVLIHIGLDTVKLGGTGFKTYVKEGDEVKKGDLLVTFDKEYIEQQGYDCTVIFIVTSMGDRKDLQISFGENVKSLETIMKVK